MCGDGWVSRDGMPHDGRAIPSGGPCGRQATVDDCRLTGSDERSCRAAPRACIPCRSERSISPSSLAGPPARKRHEARAACGASEGCCCCDIVRGGTPDQLRALTAGGLRPPRGASGRRTMGMGPLAGAASYGHGCVGGGGWRRADRLMSGYGFSTGPAIRPVCFVVSGLAATPTVPTAPSASLLFGLSRGSADICHPVGEASPRRRRARSGRG
jgi:hypothetical protein